MVQKYLEDYVEHFNLSSKLRLGTGVTFVKRDDASGKWEVQIKGSPSEFFDKVVMATGINQEPYIPKLVDGEKFEGQSLHSRAFKR